MDEDEKSKRASLALPLTKELIYLFRQGIDICEAKALSYEVVDTYMPSETHSLKLILGNGEEVRILAPFFSEMQKPAFKRNMKKFFCEEE